MRVVCYGDSDTYGHNPRSYLGGRYPEDVRWTGRLQQTGKWEIVNLGVNGREIPKAPTEDLQQALPEADLLLILLGSNDILNPRFTAEDVTERMDRFLDSLPEVPVLLIAPPPLRPGLWVREDRILEETARMGDCYRALAERRGIPFADSKPWDIPMTFDGVHFTEEGHRRFADGVAAALDALAG